MSSNLILKIEDYSKYVVLAVKYFKERSYPDSAINCRKAAEAACKIVVYYKYNQKLADTKLEGKSLKELIVLLIHEGLSERKAINTLETLQIIGNKAAHDNIIAKDETSYAIHALNLFTEYLFKEYLKISIPKNLDAIFKEAEKDPSAVEAGKSKKPEIIEKIIVQEKFNKEAEDQIFSKIKDIEQKSEGDTTRWEELKQELLVSRKIIEELAQQKQAEETKPAQAPEKSKIFSRKNILFFSTVFLVVVIVGIFLFKNKPQENSVVKNIQIKKYSDSIYVAINKIQVLQDNPNMDFKLEQAIYTRIHNVIVANKLPISLIVTSFTGNGEKNDSVLINKAGKAGFDVVYFGNLYETALTDSNILEISGCLIGKESGSSRFNKIKFKNLSDSTILKEITDQGNMPIELYAEKVEGKSDRQMLKLMQGLSYYSKEQYSSIYNFIARYKLNLGDYKGAIKDVNEIIRKNPGSPNNAYYFGFKATLFCFDNRFDSAKIYFDRSMKIDSVSVSILTNYGNLCMSTKEYKKAEELYKKAILADPNNYFSFSKMASLKMIQKEYALAKSYALKADDLFKDDVSNTIIIANVYGYVDLKKDSAEYFYNRAIGKDSLNSDALNALAVYYQRYFSTEPLYKQKINQLLSKAKALKAQNDLQTDYNFGMAAFGSGNYKEALQHFEKIFAQNKFDSDLLSGMAQSYYRTNQPAKALLFAKKAYDFDSLNGNNLIVYALLLNFIHPGDFNKVDYYFKKALAANPANLDIYHDYGTYLARAGKDKERVDLSLKGYKLFPQDIRINSLLAYGYMSLKNYNKAKPYFEFLVTRLPNNDSLLNGYAECFLLSSQGVQDNNFLYGAGLAKKAADMNPNNANSQLTVAKFMLKGNNPKLAAEFYMRAKDLSKNVLYDEELEKMTLKMLTEENKK